ncbi:YraN family protein [Amycolatopsis sp. WAC 04169]|uniref:YraN family protein n=1 Tax=Amycolatopsis sp. WAC 04169 TaxID=2203197 RepID=UPI000F78BFA8|nr:YraN family protein [Amycolatopsis sp. WAC 04169]RSN27057.1 YraN family protein [Amycolatopsis sp. WAC 04169]
MTSIAERPPAGAPRIELGRWGEDLAVRHLERKGYVVLSRNWRCRDGELDLIATDRKVLIFCEVKTRTGLEFGTPAEAVTPDKADRIRRLAYQWQRKFMIRWCPVRYDIVAIVASPDAPPRVRHIKAAF